MKKKIFGKKEKDHSEDGHNTTKAVTKKMSKNERIELLNTVAGTSENSVCADCCSSPVAFLSSNLGCLLCQRCGDLHKKLLPEHISLPVALSEEALHERNAWVNHPVAPDILLYFSAMGNKKCNSRWEARLPVSDSSSKMSGIDNISQFIEEKYLQRDFAREEVWEIKTVGEKKKKQKKKYLMVDEKKKVSIYISDPRNQPDIEVQPELIINLEESTLQFDVEADTFTFSLMQRGASTVIDCLSRKDVFDVMFAIHRSEEKVLETSPFHLGKWLDRIGFLGAIQAQDLNKVKEYCKEDPKYCMVRNERNWTPLHTACNEGQIELASMLLDFDVDVTFRNTSGATALHYFFGRKQEDLAKSTALLEKICAKQPDIDWNGANNGGATYLHFAVQVNSEDFAVWLIQKGANADLTNDRGFTPLLTAVWQNQVPVVKLMLDKGADIFVKTKQGKSALQLAEDRKHQEMYDMLFEIWETRRIQNQNNVINEILSTETDYIDRLDILVNLYKKMMVQELHLSEKAIKSLFSNVEDIYQEAKNFLKDIQPVADLPPEKKDIGACFVRHLKYFQKYIPYCTNQSISMKSLDVCMSHPHFAEVTRKKEAANKEKLRSEKIDGFLIKPLQRITRFPLLLRELQRYTPENHLDFNDLKEAGLQLAEIVGKANEAKRVRDHVEEVMETFAQQGVQWSLTSRLVMEGKCAISGLDSKLDSSCWFLFSDVFVLAKESLGRKSKITNLVILSTLPLLWDVTGKEASKLCQFAFSLVLPDRADVKITLCFKTREGKVELMETLTAQIMTYMNENERKALMATKQGVAMGGVDKQAEPVDSKDKDRPIFYEEIFEKGKEPKGHDAVARKERDVICFDSKLLRRIGVEKDDNVFDKLRGQRGRDLDRKNLFTAIRNSDLAQVKALLEQSSDYCHIKDKDMTPLHLAAQVGNLEVIQQLIDHGADLRQKDKKGNNSFHCFFRTKFDDVRATEALLDGLSDAVEEGFIDFDSTNNIGYTCLMCAVEGAGQGQLVPWLLRKGRADPNAQNKNGETPLLIAVRARSMSAVSNLLGGGADVWVKSNSGETVVTVAHEINDPKVWQLILRRLNDHHWKRPPPPKKHSRNARKENLNKAPFGRSNRSSGSSQAVPKSGAHGSPSSSFKPGIARSSSPSPSTKRSGSTTRVTRSSSKGHGNSFGSAEKSPFAGHAPTHQRPLSTMNPQNLSRLRELENEKDDFKLSRKTHKYISIKLHRDELESDRLESYLTDKDFEHVFGLTKAEFYKKPAWKRTLLKKEVDLF